MIKIIASDMDGTLITHEGIIPERNINAIKKAIEKGVLFVPATGRTHSTIPPTVMDNFNIKYTISSNGASVYDMENKKFIYNNLMDKNIAKDILDYVLKYDVVTEVYCNGDGFFPRYFLDRLEEVGVPTQFAGFYKKQKMAVDDIYAVVENSENGIEKINIPWIKPEVRAELLANLKRDWGDKIYITSSMPNNIELCSKTTNKGDGLKHLCDILGIKPEEAMAIGDNLNDLEMIEFAGVGVAMENGADEVKEIANFTTINNVDGGVGFAIEKFCL